MYVQVDVEWRSGCSRATLETALCQRALRCPTTDPPTPGIHARATFIYHRHCSIMQIYPFAELTLSRANRMLKLKARTTRDIWRVELWRLRRRLALRLLLLLLLLLLIAAREPGTGC